jgi:CheY-like chemotaxis protein
VVTNLLDNAIKFTSETGKIEVVVGVHDGEAVLELKDDGRGIDTATLPRVFDFFAQGEDSLDRAHGGLGIGLTIVRGLVELHSGHVEARSEGAGQGSTFVVRLPLCAAPAVSSALQANAPSPSVQGLRVLVIDDYEDARAALKVLLEVFGHTVRTAADGQRGVNIAREWQPDVALVDIGLPGMDGFAVAARLRDIDGEIRLFALTGYGQDEVRARALKTGFDDCLVKPVSPELLNLLLSNRVPVTALV